jgi:uncharacterized protein YqgV (UPF0045/DUF77 family)
MEIAVFSLEKESSPNMGDFVSSCLRMSAEKGARCEPTLTGARIEGDKSALLEILSELDSASFNLEVKKRVVVMLRVDEGNGHALTQMDM